MDFGFDQTLEQTLQETNWSPPIVNPLHIDISLETSGIQWHQNPNRRGKKRRKTNNATHDYDLETFRELCSGFNGKFSAIAWSDKNIVAFTSIEGISLREDRIVQTSTNSSTSSIPSSSNAA